MLNKRLDRTRPIKMLGQKSSKQKTALSNQFPVWKHVISFLVTHKVMKGKTLICEYGM